MISPLHEALAERLGASPEAVDEAVQALVADLRRRVSRDGEAHVDGLGTFRRHVGALVFEPAPELALAVNHRFAGLGEVTVDAWQPQSPEPAFRKKDTFVAPPTEDEAPEDATEDEFEAVETPEPPAPPPPARDLAFEIDDEPASDDAFEEPDPFFDPEPEDEPAFESDEEPAHDAFDDAEPDAGLESPEPDELVFEDPDALDAPLPLDVPDEEPPASEDDEGLGETTDDPIFWEMDEDDPHPLGPPPSDFEDAEFDLVDAPEAIPAARSPYAPPTLTPVSPSDIDEGLFAPPFSEPEPDDAPPAPPPAPPPVEEVRERNPAALIAGIVLILAVAAAAYFLLPGDDPAPAPPIAVETPPPAASVDTSATTPADTTVAAVPPVAEPEPEPAAPVDTGDPLRGGTIDPGAGGYAIIVSSWTTRADAERAQARYRDDGFRTGILTEVTGGTTRYRVGVGQFATSAAADEVRRASGTDLPDGAWVYRVR